MVKPTPSNTSKKTTKAAGVGLTHRSSKRSASAGGQTRHSVAPQKASKPTPGLHYSKEDLHADYDTTYSWFMKALAVGILGALLYFFIMIIYLGAFGHTPTDDYVREFGSRIQYEYKGLRLPEYDDPSLLDKPAEKDAH